MSNSIGETLYFLIVALSTSISNISVTNEGQLNVININTFKRLGLKYINVINTKIEIVQRGTKTSIFVEVIDEVFELIPDNSKPITSYALYSKTLVNMVKIEDEGWITLANSNNDYKANRIRSRIESC